MLQGKKGKLKRKVQHCMFALQSRETQESNHSKPKIRQGMGWLGRVGKQGANNPSLCQVSRASHIAAPTTYQNLTCSTILGWWAERQSGWNWANKKWGEAARLIFTGDLNHNSAQVTFYIFSPLFLFNLWKQLHSQLNSVKQLLQ